MVVEAQGYCKHFEPENHLEMKRMQKDAKSHFPLPLDLQNLHGNRVTQNGTLDLGSFVPCVLSLLVKNFRLSHLARSFRGKKTSRTKSEIICNNAWPVSQSAKFRNNKELGPSKIYKSQDKMPFHPFSGHKIPLRFAKKRI